MSYRSPDWAEDRCEWGVYAAVLSAVCPRPATTTRQRRVTNTTVRLCDEHAERMDRIYRSVEKNKPILDRLAADD